MKSASFYASLPTQTDFSHVGDDKHFCELPQDWLVVISDVRSSTQALLQGKYKQVNAAAVAMIVAVRNCYQHVELPFVFGGDGATICVPPGSEQSLHQCLSSSISKADSLGLHLRVAVIPVSSLCFGNQCIKVSKLKVSEYYNQACFSGGGIRFAERILKDPILSREFLVEESHSNADYSGFECRWNSVESRHGETVSLIIETKEQSEYAVVWQEIQRITGGKEHCHPLTSNQLAFAWSPAKLATEVRIRSKTNSLLSQCKKYLNIVLMNIVGGYLMDHKVKTDQTDWGRYKQDFVANCDFIKFEDGLKTCICCTGQQRHAIVTYLAEKEQAGQLQFGIHVAKAALITCMINAYQSQHIHFIDGDRGGYSLAAANLKEKLAQQQTAL